MYGSPIIQAGKPVGAVTNVLVNDPAMAAYSAMTEAQKQDILSKPHNARSEKKMKQIVNSLVN